MTNLKYTNEERLKWILDPRTTYRISKETGVSTTTILNAREEWEKITSELGYVPNEEELRIIKSHTPKNVRGGQSGKATIDYRPLINHHMPYVWKRLGKRKKGEGFIISLEQVREIGPDYFRNHNKPDRRRRIKQKIKDRTANREWLYS